MSTFTGFDRQLPLPRTDDFTGFLDLGVDPRRVHLDPLDLGVRQHAPTPGDRTEVSPPSDDAPHSCAISHVFLVIPAESGRKRAQRDLLWYPEHASPSEHEW